MSVKRIVTNIATEHVDQAKSFYSEILGLKLVMDFGWIQTFASEENSQESGQGNGQEKGKRNAAPQISIAAEGGSGTPTPNISIEVDNFEEVYQRVVDKKLTVEYGPVLEPWGVRRFYVRDPFGQLINILTHEDTE